MSFEFPKVDRERVYSFTDTYTGGAPRAFNAYYVPTGAPLFYLAPDAPKATAPTVEIYDAEEIRPAGHPLGQYVCSYYESTLIEGHRARMDNMPVGHFAFHGGVPAWTITGATYLRLMVWVAEQGTPSAEKAHILAGHPVRFALADRRAARHGEIYGSASAFRPYAPGGGWYAKLGTADCGNGYSNIGPDGLASMSTGYMVDKETGLSYCYDCGGAMSKRHLREAGERRGKYQGYIYGTGTTEDPYRLTNWTGTTLAKVVRHRESRNDIGTVHSWVVEAENGQTFYGRNGGPGLTIMVRPHTRRPSYLSNLPAITPISE